MYFLLAKQEICLQCPEQTISREKHPSTKLPGQARMGIMYFSRHSNILYYMFLPLSIQSLKIFLGFGIRITKKKEL